MRQIIVVLVLSVSCLPVRADQCGDFEIAVVLHRGALDYLNTLHGQEGSQKYWNANQALIAAQRHREAAADAARGSFSGQAATDTESLRVIRDAIDAIFMPLLERTRSRNTPFSKAMSRLSMASSDAYFQSIQTACDQWR